MLALARHEAAQGRRVLIGTYKPVAELLRAALAEAPDANIHIAHFGSIRGLDGWKDFDTVIVAGREQPQPLDVENMARSLFGADAEPLLLTGEYVPQMRGHRTKDGTRTAVPVQVHPGPPRAGPRRAGPRARGRADGRPPAAGPPRAGRRGCSC